MDKTNRPGWWLQDDKEVFAQEGDRVVKSTNSLSQSPRSNCCNTNFTHPGWPDSDVCENCKEHCSIIRSDKEIMSLPIEELTDDEKERGIKIVNIIDELSQEGFYN